MLDENMSGTCRPVAEAQSTQVVPAVERLFVEQSEVEQAKTALSREVRGGFRRRLGGNLIGALAALLVVACGDRDSKWDEGVGDVDSYGLSGSVALLDDRLDRIVLLTSPADGELATKEISIGKNVAAIARSADAESLFVLSKGVQPRRNPEDELPKLSVLDGGPNPKLVREFTLTDPMLKLAVDPEGEWVAAFEGDSTVTNPNEIVLLSLDDDEDEPRSKTIRSFGGFPLELIFTEPLNVPEGGARRFLVVRTDRDVTLVDLEHLDQDEVTVKLPQTEGGESAEPAQIVYDDGDIDDPSDARLAVRLAGESDIVLLQLGTPTTAGKDFSTTVNIVDAGGIPSAIDFVQTDGGLRLAALVPGRSQATLIDPRTTLTETVAFPVPYAAMRRITDVVGGGVGDNDVALLYSSQTRGIAFWSLGQTSGTPFRSVDANDIDLAVEEVLDVPAPNEHLKLLSGTGASRFFVLDLEKRQTFPMLTRSPGFEANVAPDGRRIWAFHSGLGDFSSVELSDLHPTSLSVRQGVSQVHDIERADGSRAAIVLHGTDDANGETPVAATLIDAEHPDSAETHFFGGLLLEGL